MMSTATNVARPDRHQVLPNDLLGMQEMADALDISTVTLRRLVRDPVDPMPSIRIGWKIRFSVAAVREWVENRSRRQANLAAAQAPPPPADQKRRAEAAAAEARELMGKRAKR